MEELLKGLQEAIDDVKGIRPDESEAPQEAQVFADLTQQLLRMKQNLEKMTPPEGAQPTNEE